jgi:hypothetical protein
MVTAGNYFREAAFAWEWSNRQKPKNGTSVAVTVSGEVAL